MPRKTLEERRAYNQSRRARLQEERGEQYWKERKSNTGWQDRMKADHPKEYRAYRARLQREWRDKNPRGRLINESRSRAKVKGLEHNITEQDLAWPTHCPIFGAELDYTTKSGSRNARRRDAPSLDRLDNEKGYVVGNVFVISQRANILKSNMTVAQLQALLLYIQGALTSG